MRIRVMRSGQSWDRCSISILMHPMLKKSPLYRPQTSRYGMYWPPVIGPAAWMRPLTQPAPYPMTFRRYLHDTRHCIVCSVTGQPQSNCFGATFYRELTVSFHCHDYHRPVQPMRRSHWTQKPRFGAALFWATMPVTQVICANLFLTGIVSMWCGRCL